MEELLVTSIRYLQLDLEVYLFPSSEEQPHWFILISILTVQLCILTRNLWVFSLPHIFFSMNYHSFYWLFWLVNLKVVFIYIFLMTKHFFSFKSVSQPFEFLLLRILCLDLYPTFKCLLFYFLMSIFVEFLKYILYIRHHLQCQFYHTAKVLYFKNTALCWQKNWNVDQ